MQPTHHWHDRHGTPRPYFLSRLPRVELEITRGRARNKRRRVEEATYLIGAGRQCDLILGDPQFASVHGYLLVGPQGVVLRHLGFDPELTVDGRPVRSAVLADNARIRTGPFEFRVHIFGDVESTHVGAAEPEVIELDGAIDRLRWIDARLNSQPLRLFRGTEERRRARADEAAPRHEASTQPAKPPAWPHYSHLLLSS